jgi:Tfp pilus assembly protein PilF
MHPELLNNSLFLKYYKQWQDDPSSVVFTSIADFFLKYGMLDAAFKVCQEGLKIHPDLVSGRIVMAKIHVTRGNWAEAEGELQKALAISPQNQLAKNMMIEIDALISKEVDATKSEQNSRLQAVSHDDTSWHTLTMADIFAKQGHNEKAKEIYLSVLSRDPDNEAARKGIESLSVASQR